MQIHFKCKMERNIYATFWAVTLCVVLTMAQTIKEYNMDEFATCGRTLNVDDTGIRLIGRGNAAPSIHPQNALFTFNLYIPVMMVATRFKLRWSLWI
uniref:Uncharacterized protein n=1 Tax=Arion vulgaris TaxID=1028688 RepID=A0A0B6YUC5_9EUPU